MSDYRRKVKLGVSAYREMESEALLGSGTPAKAILNTRRKRLVPVREAGGRFRELDRLIASGKGDQVKKSRKGFKVKSDWQARRQKYLEETGKAGKYMVVYDYAGKVLPFGSTEDSSGGMPLILARIVRWAKNPRVVQI